MSDAEVDLFAIHNERLDAIRKRTGAEPIGYDLGCGKRPEERCIGLDWKAKAPGVKTADLFSFPWTIDGDSLADESVDFLTATHFVEHIPDWDAHFREAYRVLKMGGHYKIIGPYYNSVRAWQDPDHKQALSEPRFLYLHQPWLRANSIDHYGTGGAVNFEVVPGWQFFYAWNQDYAGKADEVRDYAKAHYFNVVDDIACILVKLPLLPEVSDGMAGN